MLKKIAALAVVAGIASVSFAQGTTAPAPAAAPGASVEKKAEAPKTETTPVKKSAEKAVPAKTEASKPEVKAEPPKAEKPAETKK